MDNTFSFGDFLSNNIKKTNKDAKFYLQDGVNVVRFASLPIIIHEAFVVEEIKSKETGEIKKIEHSEIVYDGCTYGAGSKPKFLSYIIDSQDQRNEDGTVKLKLFVFNTQIAIGIEKEEQARVLQGGSKFYLPMDIDFIIRKEGKGMTGTKYLVNAMLTANNNKVSATKEEILEALEKVDDLGTWKQKAIEETKARHEKFGVPKLKEVKKEVEKTVQIDPDHVQAQAGVEYPQDDINAEDIPF